ncbi:MAG: tetratricopeptide repeat protein [Planctomycetota bacterium]|nr:tetratricopeptide repeat protein [Planctomycetota bacterium]
MKLESSRRNDFGPLHKASHRLCVQLAALVSVLAFSANAEEAAPKPEKQQGAEQLSKLALSEEAQKVADKYMNIILEDPRNEFAFEQVYQVYESERKTWKLLDFFVNAARLQRKNPKLQMLLGLAYYRFRDYFKSAQHFKAALVMAPDDFFSRLMLGRIYLKQSDSRLAKVHLVEAIKAAPVIDDVLHARLLLGEALMLDEDRENAQKAWDEVFKDQYDIPTLRRLSSHYHRHKFYDSADKVLDRILDLAKKNPKLSSDILIERSDLWAEQDEVEKAVTYLRGAQELLSPDSALGQEVEVRILEHYRSTERLGEFFSELEDEVKQKAHDISPKKELIRLYLKEGRSEPALVHVAAALEIDRRDVPLLELAIESFIQAQQPLNALPLLDALREVTGGAPDYLVKKGNIQWDAGQKDAALQSWNSIVEVENPEPQHYRILTRALRNHELKDAAIDAYKKTIALSPGALDSKLDYAEYLLSLGMKDEAKTTLDALTEYDDKTDKTEPDDKTDKEEPDGPNATLFLQVAELYANYDMEEALVEVLQRGKTRHDEDYRIHRRLGLALERMQKYDQAITSFFDAYDRASNWRDREALIDKLISLHLGYGKSTRDGKIRGNEGLGHLILKLYKDHGNDPDSPEPFMGLARIASVVRPTAQTAYRASPVYVKGLSAISPMERDLFPMGPMNAISFYTQALERDPMRIDAYEGLARSFMLFDEFERAVMEYKKLAIVNPVGKWKYYFAVGDFFASQGQMPEARAFWNRVAERAFTDATLYFRLAARYHWAERPKLAIRMIRRAIELHPDDHRYHLAYANILSEAEDFNQAIHEYREALRLTTENMQSMQLEVRKTMSRVQVFFARQLFEQEKFQEALDVYEEIRGYQEVLNNILGDPLEDYPDVLIQIIRCRAKIKGGQPELDAYREVAGKFPDATCWVNRHLRMSVDYFIQKESEGFAPAMLFSMAQSDQKLPAISVPDGWPVRLYPWILQPTLSPAGMRLVGKYREVLVDPISGRKSPATDRRGYVKHFGKYALRAESEKVSLSEIQTGKTLWESALNWTHDFVANSQVAIGAAGGRRGFGKLQAVELKTGKSLWDAAALQKFQVNEEYVTLKRVKAGKRATGGGTSLAESATGDAESIGYIFQVLDPLTGKVLFNRTSGGSHYWRVPVAVGDLVLLTDGFTHIVYAYDIKSGKLKWQSKFDEFFAAPPMVVDNRIHIYMRRPKQKTIIQYVLAPTTGEIVHQTDMQVNSLYAPPIPIGNTLFFYDPVAYELLGIDRKKGGVTGRYGVKKALTEVSRRNVVTLEGMDNHIYFYTWDGLIVRLDVAQ